VGRGGYTVQADSVEADVTAVAAPVLAGDKVVAAVSIVAPSYRTTAEAAEKFGLLLAEQAGTLFAAPETAAANATEEHNQTRTSTPERA
jgi:urocanate hydratase